MKRKTLNEFITKAKLVHGDKYDYSLVNYINRTSKVIIICKKHGEFLQQPRLHIHGYGCCHCGGNYKMSTEEYIACATRVYGDKYDYSQTIYINRESKIKVICKQHNIKFEQSAITHLKHIKCMECRKQQKRKNGWTTQQLAILMNLYSTTSNEELKSKIGKSVLSLKAKARQLNLKKTKLYRTTISYQNSGLSRRNLTTDVIKNVASKYNTRMEFQSKYGTAYKYAREQGILDECCLHMKKTRYSTPQLMLRNIMNYLLQSPSLYNDRKIIKPYEIDIYYPEFNLALEYQGKYWHEHNKNDKIKVDIFYAKNINIIYIFEISKNYEVDIKNQLITHLNLINKISNKNITADTILNYKIENVYDIHEDTNDLFKISRKYSVFKDFVAAECAVYSKLIRLNLLKEATAHMKKRRHITIDEISKIVKNFDTLKDLIKYDSGAYGYIKRHKLEHMISHMKQLQYSPRKQK